MVIRNGYWNKYLILLKQVTITITININNNSINIRDINNLSDRGVPILKLPYQDDRGINVKKSIKMFTKKTLPDNHDVRIILTGTKFCFHFNIKDNTSKQDKHDLVSSRSVSPLGIWSGTSDSWLGEIGRRSSESVVDQAGGNAKSHILRHCLNSYHKTVSIGNFIISGVEYNNKTFKRRMLWGIICEAVPLQSSARQLYQIGAFWLILIVCL